MLLNQFMSVVKYLSSELVKCNFESTILGVYLIVQIDQHKIYMANSIEKFIRQKL